jgi:RNA-directed DNA polymerase
VRNPDEKLGDRTQGRTYLPDHLIRVNDAAKRSCQTRFTALLHHIDVEALERAFRRLRRKAAPGSCERCVTPCLAHLQSEQ